MPKKKPAPVSIRVVLFDTETTSLISNSAMSINKQPRIIELFAQKLLQIGEGPDATFKEIGRYSKLTHPGQPIPEKVVEITGITDDDVKDAPRFNSVAEEVVAFMEDADRVVAHNLSYDIEVTDFEMQRCNRPGIKWPEKVCTVEATEYMLGFRMSLTMLYEHLFNEKFADAHRAENDVLAMSRCYQELVRRRVI